MWWAVPKEFVDRAKIASSTALSLGGSSVGLLLFGLLGNVVSKRKRFWQSVSLCVVVLLLYACSSGLEEAAPNPTITLPENLIEFPIGKLQPDTTYYWMVRATVTDTGKSRDSAVRKFTTE